MNPFARLTDDELTALAAALAALLHVAEPLLDASRLPADAWQLPLDALHWQQYNVCCELDIRGCAPPEIAR